MQETQGVYAYINTAFYTDWVFTLATTYQLPLAGMLCVTGNDNLVVVCL